MTTENEQPNANLQKQDPTSQPPAPVPADLIRDAGRGTENIGADDVRPPRLLICQAGSPQRKPDDAKQIVGLQELDMFNDLSGEIYGRGPLNFIVISSLGSRHIEFAPMSEGGGVIDYDVAPDDPRAQFTSENGKRVKPVATKFYDYLAWLPEQQELVALSMKSTQIKTAIKLNGLLKLPLRVNGAVIAEPPAWARTFALETKMDKKDTYSWGSYNLKTIGVTPEETRDICSTLADVYSKKRIVIEREDDPDPDGDEPPMGNEEPGNM